MKRIIPIICLLFFACTPPGYEMKFRSDGLIVDKAVIEESDKRVEIKAYHQPDWDQIYFDVNFIGPDSLSGKNRMRYIGIESNTFFIDSTYYKNENKFYESTCSFSLRSKHNIDYKHYTAFIDTSTLAITIHDYFSKLYRLEVIFNKKWIQQRYGQ